MSDAKKPIKVNISDVAQPGKSAPSETSKPVLVSNRPILKDPMVVDQTAGADDTSDKLLTKTADKELEVPGAPPLTADAATADQTSTAAPTPIKVKKDTKTSTAQTLPAATKPDEKVEALTDAATPETPAENTDTAEPTKPEPEPATDTDKTTVEKQTADEASTITEADATASNEADTADASDKPVKQTDEEVDAEVAKQAKHDAAIQKLVDSKQYSLPINAVEKRRSKRFVLLGILLSLLLALTWADIALDAGIIQFHSVKPLTHFFSN